MVSGGGGVCVASWQRGSFFGGARAHFFLCVLCTLPSYCQPSLAAEVLEYHVACQFHGLALDVYLVLDGDERHETRPIAPSRLLAAKTAYENAKKSPTRGRCRPHTTHALAPPYVDSCAGLCLWCGLRAAGCGLWWGDHVRGVKPLPFFVDHFHLFSRSCRIDFIVCVCVSCAGQRLCKPVFPTVLPSTPSCSNT